MVTQHATRRSVEPSPALDAVLGEVASLGILVPDRDGVRVYLSEHPDMADLTRRVCARAAARLGTAAQVSLEVYRDPEADDEDLAVYFRQRQYDEGIMAAIDGVWPEYARELADMSGYILLTTDFQPPR